MPLLVSVLLAVVVVLMVGAGSALVARGHEFTTTFVEPCITEPCTGASLKKSNGVAVNEATSDVYVVDKGNNCVEGLNARCSTGRLFTAFAGAIVDAADNLLAYYPAKKDMFSFAQSGTANPTVAIGLESLNVGIGVDAVGNLYKATKKPTVEQFSSTGTDIGPVDQPNTEILKGFAVKPTGPEVFGDRAYAWEDLRALV